jgi:uncharacterized membrane protein
MNRKKYNQLRAVVILFVAAIVALAVNRNSYLLSVAGIVTGMLFLALARFTAKIRVDEREATIRQKAAQFTYAVIAPTIGISAVLLLIPSRGNISVFSKGEFLYTESLGMIFAYLTLFLITTYAVSFFILNRKYGGGGNEE